jgi:hypothetical protein
MQQFKQGEHLNLQDSVVVIAVIEIKVYNYILTDKIKYSKSVFIV